MYAHEYGKKYFKHKIIFDDLVVFSDAEQQNVSSTQEASENTYLEIEKDHRTTGKWFVHFDRRLSGEYGDFYLENNPESAGSTTSFEYEVTEDTYSIIQNYIEDFSDGNYPYFKINDKFYIRLNNTFDLDEVVIKWKNKIPPTADFNVEDKAFVTLFISDDGALLERAYQVIDNINTHEVVMFMESGGGINLFGTVFRIHKGDNVKRLIETNRINIAEIARKCGVDIASNELTEMIKEEIADQGSFFYLVNNSLKAPARVIRWGVDAGLSVVSDALGDISEEIEKTKIGENRWKALIDGKKNPDYNPLLPGYETVQSFSPEKLAKSIEEKYFTPYRSKIIDFAKNIKNNYFISKIVNFDIDTIIKFIDSIPEVIKVFLETIKSSAVHLFRFINGLIIGLINSLIELFRSIFDILKLIVDILNVAVQSTVFFDKPMSYLSLFAESIENFFDIIYNAMTLENLKAFVDLITNIPIASAQAIINLINRPASTEETEFPADAVGYYLGFIIGFVASEILTFFATGGTGNIAKAVKTILQSYKSLAKTILKTITDTVKFTLQTIVNIIRKLLEFSRNIPKHIKDLRKMIDDFIESLKYVTNKLLDELFPKGSKDRKYIDENNYQITAYSDDFIKICPI